VQLDGEFLEHDADLLAQLPPGAPVAGIKAGHHDVPRILAPVAFEDFQGGPVRVPARAGTGRPGLG
jgi:hypothetical protein